MFTAFGAYNAARGIYYLIGPEAAGFKDTLGFAPSFQPFVIAVVCLIIGVHFIRGEAHRPDLFAGKRLNGSTGGRTHSWWTGESLDNLSDHDDNT